MGMSSAIAVLNPHGSLGQVHVLARDDQRLQFLAANGLSVPEPSQPLGDHDRILQTWNRTNPSAAPCFNYGSKILNFRLQIATRRI